MSMSNLKKTKIDDKIIHTNKHDNEERRKRLVILKRRKGQNDKIKCGTNIKRKGFIFYRNFYFVLFLLVYIFQSFNECPFNHYCSYQEKKQHYRILADYHNISDTSTNKTNTLFEPSNVKKEEQKNKQTKNSGLSHMFSSEINKTQTNESNNKREISLTVKNQKNQTNKSKNNKKDKRNISISNKRNQSISSNNNNNNNKEEEEECTKNFTQYLHYFNSNFRENQNINTTPTNEFSEQQQQQQHHNDLKNKNKNNSEGHNYTHTNLPNNNNNNKVKGQQYNHQTENKNKNKIINYPRQDSQTSYYGRYTSRTNNQPRQDNQTNYYSRYTSRSNNPPRQDSQTSYYGRYTSRTNNQHRSENENDDESDYDDDDEELQGHSVVYNDKIRKSNNRHESLHSYNIKETPKKNKKKSQRNNTNNNKTDNYDFNKHTSQQINSESNGSYGYNQQYNHSTQHELFIPQAHYTPYQQITPYGPSGQIVHYGPYIQNGNHIEPVPYVVTSSGELMVPQYNANGAYVAVPVDAITQQQINLYIDSTVQRRELQMRNVYTQELVQYKRELDLEHQYKKKTLKFQQLLINAAMLSLLIGSIFLCLP
ncbi:hypothetical protein PFFVO_00117 [Plasmodium falciparum Vietnam Oak-Knoll (FVO)]|uniref:Uncharacterized protein n=1 Tax=Plasmodium falciparum Vietnam Oak-Knoll (FVO) TaxID=1036723 RepID=A0A024VDU0_PLAFA|nr:hypothetical protein PFFVO_00117 [Plasmodium falciparum Vietnam Oak-Knoll (FVO)]